MNNIKLIPITLKGKNKIANVKQSYPDWNGYWRILSKMDSVVFAKGERGPWLLVEPLIPDPDKFKRWVNSTNDKDFGVENSND